MRDECLAHVLPKLDRAEKHLGDLDAAIKDFIATNPYVSVIERDPKTGECIDRLKKITAPPVAISLIAGDAIQNLMSALDHLAYQLVSVSCGGQPPNPKWIYFPVADDATSYQAKREGKMKGARQDILDEIDSIEPYKGGSGNKVWTLYSLNNIEKHRLLFTVAAALSHWDFTAPSGGDLVETDHSTGKSVSVKFATLRAAEMRPLKEGDIISRFPCESKLNEYAQARVSIALCEPGITQVQGVVPLVLDLGKEVEKVINKLSPFLK